MKVLNIGSLNIDRTYSVEHFVGPKETIKAKKYEEFCGGKGMNQSIALARAGVEVYHAGKIGRDGKALVELLESSGVCVKYMSESDSATGHAIIQVDATGQNNIIISGGANDEIDEAYISNVLSEFEAGDILLLQNEISNVGYAIEEAKKRGIKVVFNPSPINEIIESYPLKKVDYFILNEIEGSAIAKKNIKEQEAVEKALITNFPDAAFILTLGENGSVFFDKDRRIIQNAYPTKAIDTTGAGDTFCGYFIAGLVKGFEIEKSLKMASAAGAVSVSRKGAAQSIPLWKETEEFINKQEI